MNNIKCTIKLENMELKKQVQPFFKGATLTTITNLHVFTWFKAQNIAVFCLAYDSLFARKFVTSL